MLLSYNYIEAAAEINDFKLGSFSESLRTGYKYLMHKLVLKMYTVIEADNLKALMGFKTDKEYAKYLRLHSEELSKQGTKFVKISDDVKEEEKSIDPTNLQVLEELSKFIERENVTQISKES
jgi:uncharacterized protein (DUF1330 family)